MIDDKLASVGGLDLTRWRWDTPVHAAAHPLRHDVNELPYQSSTIPHDVRRRRRERLHGLLTQADLDDRYRLISTSVPQIATDCLNVHRKLMLIDDELLLVGSANLNSRSMVLDTECNMAIRAFRAR